MHINLFIYGCGHHRAAWRHPDSSVEQLGDIRYYENLARIAERGKLDAVFFADGSSVDSVEDGPRWFLEPLTCLAALSRATERIELGTAVLQTYPCHPLLQANRAVAAANGMGRPGLTLGVGPSHRPVIEGMFGMSYDHPGRNTEEYLRILAPLLRGEAVDVAGEDWTAHGAMAPVEQPVPLLLAALGPRLLRVAGELADGVVLWLAPPRAIETHVVPRLHRAAETAGRPRPRVVAGLPVAVHDDLDEARAATAETATRYEHLPNYQRILERGEVESAVGAAVLGDEASVARQLQGLLDAGATDIQAFIVPCGDDRRGSVRRPRELLASLTG